MADLFSISVNAFRYGFLVCFHNILRWLALTIVLLIPILQFVGFGILLKTLRGEEPTFENGGKCFIQGLLAFVIALIYSLIPIGVQLLTRSLGIFGIILSLAVFILFMFILIPAIVNYARKQTFLSAFMFAEIFEPVKMMTWSRFLLALLIFVIVDFLITIIISVLMLIPVLGWLVMIAVLVPFALFDVKFWNDVFA